MLTCTKWFAAALVALSLVPTPTASAQTILNENFSGIEVNYDTHYAALTLDGWQIINRDDNVAFPRKWCVYASGKQEEVNNVAFIDMMSPGQSVTGSDYLLTPELNLDGTYLVQFQWSSSAMAREKQQYDLRVRVVEEGQQPGGQDFIFSINDPQMVLESGVQPVDYGWYTVPWEGWAKNVSTLDLSAWAGKKVRIAFEYYINGEYSINSIEIDNVKVYKSEISQVPVASPSITEWNFGSVCIGSRTLSEPFSLINSGKGTMTVSSIDCPAGYSVVSEVPIDEIQLGRNESVKMQVMYDAQMTSATNGEIVFNTNGEPGRIAVTASKKVLPEGYTFEGFEDTKTVFPPAGWQNAGDWASSDSPIEGFLAAWASANMDQEGQSLITPRLDGSAGEITFEFDYYDYFIDEEGIGADNTVTVNFSKDGGNTWTKLDTFDWSGPYNEVIHRKYTNQTDGSDNCLYRITYEPLGEWDTEYGPVISRFFVDAVILPPLYGASDVPSAPELVSPANSATDVYPRNIVLNWNPAQFAKGYRLYVGTDGAATDLVNGVDLGDVLTYTIDRADYSKTYNWRVEAYNDKGSTPSLTYNFATQPDATVTTFPYFEGFEGDIFPPVGWIAEQDTYTKWYLSDYAPFDGKNSAGVQAGLEGSHAALVTPEFRLPADAMYLTFYWGDGGCINLKKDDTGVRVNPTDGSNGIADLDFEIYCDGEWHQIAKLSDPSDSENLYWYRERIDLTPYAGKTISMRWNRTISNYMKARAASLDQIEITNMAGEKLSLNLDSWDALKVNAWKEASSEKIFTLLNDGSNEAVISDIVFSGEHFSTTLNKGDRIASGSGLPFAMTFRPGIVSSKVTETMTITTEGGATATMTLTGEGMPINTQFFGFEQDTFGTLEPEGFITIDNDGSSTVQLAMVTYPNYGLPMAFVVMNYKKADWPNPYGNTGDQCLVSFATVNKTSDDWIIRPGLMCTEDSEFEFYARNYEHKDRLGGGEVFSAGQATVFVSEAEDPRDLTKYHEIQTYTLNYPEDEEYTQYIAQLGEYANKKIHVALRQSVDTEGLAYLYDDFTYRDFNFADGVSEITGDNTDIRIDGDMITVNGVDNATLTIYSVSGMAMNRAEGAAISTAGLQKGIYLLRVQSAQGVKSFRFVKR